MSSALHLCYNGERQSCVPAGAPVMNVLSTVQAAGGMQNGSTNVCIRTEPGRADGFLPVERIELDETRQTLRAHLKHPYIEPCPVNLLKVKWSIQV
jgi:hypothetical protein